MLTVQTITLPATPDGHETCAIQANALAEDLSPRAFARTDTSRQRANSMWLGSERALSFAGVKLGAEVTGNELALLLRGCDPIYGPANIKPADRRRATTGHLIFSAPNSVSWIWAQTTDASLREGIKQAMMNAAHRTLGHLARTRPLLDGEQPGTGYAAAAVLHVIARDSPQPPPPLLHVHCYLIGITDQLGDTWTPNAEALSEETVGREGGAVGRAKLAEQLAELGFQIRGRTGPGGRYFEVEGVPTEILRPEMSVRAQCDGPVQDAHYGG
ncbi:relaxase domain-containing protein [Actinomadura hibisca]|uniref:relaxase domain-containing protein n=1 Tax=Actinomadura hibisca TaxID=68565 RepID=UPI0008355C88|nr:relaxase domain-containing protein [Actinomadura hibisca]